MHCKQGRSVLPILFLPAALILTATGGRCQPVPDDRMALEAGAGAGMASYADLNGYPGPKHMLEFQDQLNLTEDQLRATEALEEEMSARAKSKGAEIITLEEQLDSLFQTGTPTREAVEDLSARIGTARGELRAIHLVTHIQAGAILNADQTAHYVLLRKNSRELHHQHQVR